MWWSRTDKAVWPRPVLSAKSSGATDTFLGYLDATLNDEAFTSDGYFRTGDLGRFDSSGGIHIVGRIKDIINRSGEKNQCSRRWRTSSVNIRPS